MANGSQSGVADEHGGAQADAVTGAAAAGTGCAARVLAAGGCRAHQRGGGARLRCVGAGRKSLVPSRWRHAAAVAGRAPGRYLSLAEREEIALLRAQDVGVRQIIRRLGRSPSTISRELRRNAATRSGQLAYRSSVAQWHAERRAGRPKVAKLAGADRLRDYVQARLAGAVLDGDGRPIPGPNVPWKGRRHGRRADAWKRPLPAGGEHFETVAVEVGSPA